MLAFRTKKAGILRNACFLYFFINPCLLPSPFSLLPSPFSLLPSPFTPPTIHPFATPSPLFVPNPYVANPIGCKKDPKRNQPPPNNGHRARDCRFSPPTPCSKSRWEQISPETKPTPAKKRPLAAKRPRNVANPVFLVGVGIENRPECSRWRVGTKWGCNLLFICFRKPNINFQNCLPTLFGELKKPFNIAPNELPIALASGWVFIDHAHENNGIELAPEYNGNQNN